MKTIELCEQEKVFLAKFNLNKQELELLIATADQQKELYFIVGRTQIAAKNYVGMLEVGNLRIIILPKIAKKQESFLTELLIYTDILPNFLTKKAHFNLTLSDLYSFYLNIFVKELQKLVKNGLIKQYETKENNENRWANKINWAQQIAKNSNKANFFYGYRWELNQNHIFNQILTTALLKIANKSWNLELNQSIKQLKNELQDIPILEKVSENFFEQLQFNRQNYYYKTALLLAKLILLDWAAEIILGNFQIWAMFTDASRLFELYLKKQLKKAAEKEKWEFEYQKRFKFWKRQFLIPDFYLKNTQKSYILDSKWKIVENEQVNMNDLRQLFSYGIVAQAEEVIVILPKAAKEITNSESFFEKTIIINETAKKIRLSLIYIELCNEKGRLELENGDKIIAQLKKKVEKK